MGTGYLSRLRRTMRRTACVAMVILGVTGAGAHAGEVSVAVAANFLKPMQSIAPDFMAATGHKAAVSGGSTGKLYSQIVAGAPFDVFLAADARTPQRLVDEGHGVTGSNFTYAIGQLVLWSADADRVDADGAVLGSDRYTKIAVANPRLAPYGAAAYEVLEARKLLDAVTPRMVTGENIGQTYQFVLTRNAEIGFVALSQVTVPGEPTAGSMWRIPQELYGEIRQDALLLERGKDNEAARALMDYLRTPAAIERIRSYGYVN
ncbi:MAG: molybdate ABC transporter substrate-binding protein [Burkholderiaceae bacterium]